MIKFFQKIRQRLLTENKFSKYLLYAIGEIVLVVIGILIALSINNWNNNNVRANEEVSLLHDMVIDLKQNIDTFNIVLNIHNATLKQNITLRRVLLNKNSTEDMPQRLIGSLTSSATPTFSTSTYKTISQTGLNIVSSDTLKKSILRYYEVILPYVNYKSNEDPKNQFQELLKPYFNKYLKLKLNSNDSIIRSINRKQDMFNDNEFLNELHTTIGKRKKLIQHLHTGIRNSEFLIQEIEQHLTEKR
tara:strand:- start:127221 stop:127958 length:738 start_codon:yes stop_codon:yes gene_type:complete